MQSKFSSPTSRIRRNLFLAILLALAAWLRLSHLDLVSFTADEGVHSLFAMNVSWLMNMPLVGLPSVGIRNSAFFIYLLSLPNFIIRDPLAGVAFIALLNVAAVYLSFRLAEDCFGTAAGVISGVFVAVSPWMVLYSRQAWPPSCLAFFSLLFIRSVLHWVEQGGERRLTMIVGAAIFFPQIHFSGACAPAWLVLVLLIGGRRPALFPVVAGLVLGIASWSPWIYWQHFANHWTDLRADFLAGSVKPSIVDTLYQAGAYFFALLQAGRLDAWFGVAPDDLPEYFPRWLVWLLRAQAPIALLSLIAAACFVIVGRSRSARLLGLWALVPLVMLAIVRPKMHPHYILIAYPIPFVLIGGAVSQWLSPANWRWLRIGIISVAGLMFVVGDITALQRWRLYLEDGRADGRQHYELTYRQRRTTVRAILNDAGERRIAIAGGFSGYNPAYETIYIVEQMRQNALRFPEDRSRLYWIDHQTDNNLGDDPAKVLRRFRGFGPFVVEKHWRVGPSRIFLLHLSQ